MSVPETSLVIPIYNELDNIQPLFAALDTALRGLDFEVILVDDGSLDGTGEALDAGAARLGERYKVIHLQRNFGQTAAMQAGIDAACGEVIVTLDGDLQNDPGDVPMLVKALRERDMDVVAGWRKNRQDGLWLRKIPSRAANWLIGRLTGVRLHDYGCTLKAYRASVLKAIRLYGEMHRFIPAWLATQTYTNRIIEVPVRHHPRVAGKSKYGISRTSRVFVDLLFVKFFMRFNQRPMHFFGTLGLGFLLLGLLILGYLFGLKLFTGASIGGRPMLLIGILGVIAGIQWLSTGLVGEMLSRIYYESQGKKSYVVRRTVHLEPAERWA